MLVRAVALSCKINQLPSPEHCGLTLEIRINKIYRTYTQNSQFTAFAPSHLRTNFFVDNPLFVTKMYKHYIDSRKLEAKYFRIQR
jgi:hypothetical protein